MNKIEKLISEIRRYKHKADERLKLKGRSLAEEQKDSAIQNLCGNLLHFAESISDDPVSDNLNKEIQTTIKMVKYLDLSIDDIVSFCAHHYSKWQKDQMMKDAIDTTIKQGCIELGIFVKGLDKNKFSFGDKIKVLIIKDD